MLKVMRLNEAGEWAEYIDTSTHYIYCGPCIELIFPDNYNVIKGYDEGLEALISDRFALVHWPMGGWCSRNGYYIVPMAESVTPDRAVIRTERNSFEFPRERRMAECQAFSKVDTTFFDRIDKEYKELCPVIRWDCVEVTEEIAKVLYARHGLIG